MCFLLEGIVQRIAAYAEVQLITKHRKHTPIAAKRSTFLR
jgi:hypothetical protein